MKRQTIFLTCLSWFCLAMIVSRPAMAVEVQDLAKIKGEVSGDLVGVGLVVGLNGSGDGSDYAPAQRAVAEMVKQLMDPNTVATEMREISNVALVTVTATIPSSGVRAGEAVDVRVSSIGNAKSLKGGRLFLCPLLPGDKSSQTPLAMAYGPVILDDKEDLRTGTIKRGAKIRADFMTQYINRLGQLTLVLSEANASWPLADMIARLINDTFAVDGPPIARAIDQKTILVQVPRHTLLAPRGPSPFITRVLQLPVPTDALDVEAKVLINRRTQTITMSGNVEISPVIVSHKGLSIQIEQPKPEPDPQQPVAAAPANQNQQNRQPKTGTFVGLEMAGRNHPHRANMRDLIKALNQLNVPTVDQIDIITQLHKMGKIHAQLVIED